MNVGPVNHEKSFLADIFFLEVHTYKRLNKIPKSTLLSQLVSRAFFFPVLLFYIGPPVRSQNQIPCPDRYPVFVFPSKAKSSSFRWTFSDFCSVFALLPPELLTAEIKPDKVQIASDSHCKESEVFLSLCPWSLQEREKGPQGLCFGMETYSIQDFCED